MLFAVRRAGKHSAFRLLEYPDRIALVANPNDLLGPRRMTPPDGEQRGQVMERYRTTFTELKEMDE